ncbi:MULTISPECIES: hypothetical protein [Psychrobacillus]|uniref:GNAT family N-acetyltransferase n=1 Tax=Psychrobacillus faecigallinarum TaxID=2762235 RepID=A0ABR8RDA0_9BACI|nr:hypothetical protein [Psychrobacillus faecigallinarum]MBD7945774.1 hypothetical protein [Psychrobacillus faecigallinarum]
MELFVIKSPMQLQMYKKEWSSILELNHNTNHFFEYEFFINWWKNKAFNHNVTVFGIKENLKVIAFFPFNISIKYKIPIYQMLSLPGICKLDFIVQHSNLDRVLMFLMDKLIETHKHAVFHFTEMSEILFLKLSAYLKARNLLSKVTVSLNAPIIDEGNNILGIERLQELGNVAIDEISYSQYKEFICKSREPFCFSSSYDLTFLENLSQELKIAALELKVVTVAIEKEIVAFSFVLNCRGTYEEYAYGFHPDFTIYELEKVLSHHIKVANNSLIHSSSSNSIIVSTKTLKARYTKIIFFLKKKQLARKKVAFKKSKSLSVRKYKYLLARLTDTQVKAVSDFKGVTNIDILTSENNRRESLEKAFRKSKGYYSIDPSKAFWVNENFIFNEDTVFLKELPARSVYLGSWNRQELEKQLSFIQKIYLPNNIYVLVDFTDKASQEKLKLFGFQIIERLKLDQANSAHKMRRKVK